MTWRFAASFLAGLCWLASAASGAADISGAPRIIDGDTFELGRDRIRLWGIDAPEADAPGGAAATAFLARLVAGQNVTCRDTGGRTWGRIVAVCRLPDGTDLAMALVCAGHARDWPKFSKGRYARCR